MYIMLLTHAIPVLLTHMYPGTLHWNLYWAPELVAEQQPQKPDLRPPWDSPSPLPVEYPWDLLPPEAHLASHTCMEGRSTGYKPSCLSRTKQIQPIQARMRPKSTVRRKLHWCCRKER